VLAALFLGDAAALGAALARPVAAAYAQLQGNSWHELEQREEKRCCKKRKEQRAARSRLRGLARSVARALTENKGGLAENRES